jgi:hypothetical protein
MRLFALALAGALLAGCASSGTGAGGRAPSPRPVATGTTQVSGCFKYFVHTDRPSYPSGAPVTVIVTAMNVSARTCLGPPCGGITPWFSVATTAGKPIYRTNSVGAMCVAHPRPRLAVAPGKTVTWFRGTWSPGGTHGSFTVTWHWVQSVTVRSAPFTVA